MTWLPGEGLLIKLWETVDKLGTGLLSPIQIRREGKARADVRRYEALRDAETKRDVEELLAGRRTLDAQGKLLPGPESPSPHLLPALEAAEHPAARVIHSAQIMQWVRMIEDLEATKRLLNLRNTIRMAEQEIEDAAGDDPAQKAQAEITEDWLSRWREGAERTSSEDVQRLWARLLAGELKESGSFSLRTLAFMRMLDQHDAQLIAKIAPFVVTGKRIIKLGTILDEAGLSLDELLYLERFVVTRTHNLS